MNIRVTAQLKYLRIAPRKVRLLADTIRGLSLDEAEAILLMSARRPKTPLLKLLRSVRANAKNNHKLDPDTLYIKEVRVDQGPMLKRWTPRSRGSIAAIQKKMSHITLVVDVAEKPHAKRFSIVVKKKTKKEEEKKGKKQKSKQEVPAEKAPSAEKPKEREQKPVAETKPKETKGALKKVFRRKAI